MASIEKQVMPTRLSSNSALEAVSSNREAIWPARGSDTNRVEPVTKPRWTPKFSIERGQRVFTIGSCFSRNIEKAFLSRGFSLPARDRLKASPESKLFGPHVLNNFGLPSIINELKWAFGHAEYDFDKNLCALPEGGYVDLHLNSGLPPVSLEVAMARRRAIARMYNGAAIADLAVVVLSDTECWFDLETGLYLNTIPRQSLFERQAGRFELHILDQNDLTCVVEDILNLLQQVSCSNIITQISPSPLTVSYTEEDVLLANFRSKCVLRTVITNVTANRHQVDYYPTFEIVFHSQRSVWKDDLIHLDTDVIDRIVSDMISCLVSRGTETKQEKVERLLSPHVSPAVMFGELENSKDLMLECPELAVRFADAAVNLGKLSHAREMVDHAQDGPGQTTAWHWIEARLLFAEKRYSDALLLFERERSTWKRRPAFWPMLVSSLFEVGRWNDGKIAVKDWATLFARSSEPYRLGALFLGRSKREDQVIPARQFFEKARLLARTTEDVVRVALDYGEFLGALGRIMAARQVIDNVTTTNPLQANRLAELKLMIGLK